MRRELRKWMADKLIFWGFRLDPERFMDQMPGTNLTKQMERAERAEKERDRLKASWQTIREQAERAETRAYHLEGERDEAKKRHGHCSDAMALYRDRAEQAESKLRSE